MSRSPHALVLVTLLVLLGHGPVRADNSISVRVSGAFLRSPSFDALSDRDLLLQAEFNYARRVLDLWAGDLWVEGSWMAGSASSKLFDSQLSTKAFLQSFTFGARYTLPVWSWLVPFVRFGLGVAVGTLEVSGVGLPSVMDRGAAFTGAVLVGVELLLPHARWRRGQSSVTGGIVIEAGYGFSSSMAFELVPEESEKERQIPLQGSGLGSLSLDGAQLRVGAILRF